MSDEAAIFACSGYFLGCLRPHLTEARETKVAEGDWAAGFIGGVFAGDVSGNILAGGDFIWNICSSVKSFGTSF